jgi:hypothetical protein
VGLSHCQYDGLGTVQDEARLRRGHNNQSGRGHQCSEITLTGEAQFHISTPLGIEPGSFMTESKRVDHWTSGTVYECSEIAGSPQCALKIHTSPTKHLRIMSYEMILWRKKTVFCSDFLIKYLEKPPPVYDGILCIQLYFMSKLPP